MNFWIHPDAEAELGDAAVYYATLAAASQPERLPGGSSLKLDPDRMVLTVSTGQGDMVFIPKAMPDGRINWTCVQGEGMKPTHLPPSCRPPNP